MFMVHSAGAGVWDTAPRATQEVLSVYSQCETSLKQAIIILDHFPFFVLACLSVTKISMAGHVSHSTAVYTPLQTITSATCEFSVRGAF